MPVFVVGKKRFTEPNMCFSDLVEKSTTPTRSKSNPHFTSLVSDDYYSPILPGLPDDVAKYCLALVPHSYLPALGGVSMKWRSFIRSKEFMTVRKEAGMIEEWLYVLTMDPDGKGSHWKVLDCFGNKHRLISAMPGPMKAGFGVVGLNGKLLVMAGYSVVDGTGSASEDVYQYDSFLNRQFIDEIRAVNMLEKLELDMSSARKFELNSKAKRSEFKLSSARSCLTSALSTYGKSTYF